MVRFRHAVLLALLLTGGAAGRDAGVEGRAHALARLIRETVGAPGLSVAVASGRQIVWATGVGWADPADSTRATADTRYRIGSVTKLFTATTAAQLAAAGKLALDTPVGRYVPDLTVPLAAVTARQLAGHLAGVRHYRRGEYLNTHHYGSVREALDKFRNDTLEAAPGTRYLYSSYGYVLLSAVIEAASGREFTAEVHRATLAPLSMTETAPDTGGEVMAAPFDRRGQDVVPSPSIDLSDRLGAGGYLSSVTDLARFGTAVLDSPFADDRVRTLLFTGQHTTAGQPTHVGMGWRIGTDARGRTTYSHGGTAIGGRAVLMVFPDQQLAVAIAANLGNAGFGEPEAQLFAEIFLDSLPGGATAEAAGRYRFVRRERRGAVRGTLVLRGQGDSLSGQLLPDSGAPVPLVWSWQSDDRLDLAGPAGRALEIMWLRSSGDSLLGSTWRERNDFRAFRDGP